MELEKDASLEQAQAARNVNPLKKLSPETLGFCSALCSAVCYTVSLGAMRGLTEYQVSPYWSLAIKEFTIVACVMPIIIVQALRGKYHFRWSAFLALLAAGFSCEVVGSIPHLMAYAFIGLALATPLIQAAQLIFSSIVGALWLKERVTPSKIVALVLLIVAVFLLSGSGNEGAIAGKEMRLGLGVLCTISTAIGYCGQLSIMRRVTREPSEEDLKKNPNYQKTPTSLVMVSVTGVGVVVCGVLLTCQQGFGAWLEPEPACWKYVLTAGVANMFGFFFQIESIRRLFVLKQALVATAQTATLCLLGVTMFGEAFGLVTAVGLALVLAGVVISGFSK